MKRFFYLFFLVIFIPTFLSLMPKLAYADGELKILLTGVDRKQLSSPSVLTDQLFTVSVDGGTNNGCKGEYIATFKFKSITTGDLTHTITIDSDNNKAKFGPISYPTAQDVSINVTCNKKSGGISVHVTQDPNKQAVETPILSVDPTTPAYNANVVMKVSKCPANSTVQYFWGNSDGTQTANSSAMSPDVPFTMQFHADHYPTAAENSKYVHAICGGKQSNNISLTFQAPPSDGSATSTEAIVLPICSDLNANGKCTKVNSSIGILDTDINGLISRIVQVTLGLSGGIFLLLIIRAGYRMISSQGNPEAIKDARESLTSAIVGFLFLIFSFVILELIGVHLLQLPGLS